MSVEFYSREYQTIAQDIKNMQAEINNTDNPDNYRIKLQQELSGKKDELEACSLKINELSQENSEQMLQDASCEDGKNDGKIGFWKATGHFLKGCGNFLKNLVCDENGFSLGKTLKNAAIGIGIGALCFFTAGTAVPAIIAGAGALMAGTQAVKMGVKAYNAKTDKECEAAFEGLGEASTGLALSVAGARGAYKANVAKNGSFMWKGKDPFFAMNKGIDFAKSGINSVDDLTAQEAYIKATPQQQEAMMNQFNAWKAKQPQAPQATINPKEVLTAKESELAGLIKKGTELEQQISSASAEQLAVLNSQLRTVQEQVKATREVINVLRGGNKAALEAIVADAGKTPKLLEYTAPKNVNSVNSNKLVLERTELGKAVDSAKAFANGTAKLASDSAQMVYNGSKSAVIGTGKLVYNTANNTYLKGPIWAESIEQPAKNFTYDKLNMEEDELKSFAKILKAKAKRTKLTDKQIQELAKKFLEDNKNKDKKTA